MSRRTPVLALTALAAGLALYALATLLHLPYVDRAGLITAIAALPAVVITQQHRGQQITADQLAAAHRAGYTLALDHVARGLLDQQPAPPDGTPHHPEAGATIHQLYAVPAPPERKAQ